MFRLVGLLYLALLAALWAGQLAASRVDARINAYTPSGAEVSERAAELHASLRVADLHSDMLLWDRDHRARQTRGHTDMVRLAAGGVDLQVFSVVTASPEGQNFDANDIASGDRITTLALAQGWPLGAVTSMRDRALLQARRLRALERRGDLTIVRRAADLDADGLKGILLTEGAHPLEGDLANVDRLHAAGYRVLGLHHFFDNALGGSLHGRSGAGLTPFGRQVVARMDELGLVVDLAHSSDAVARDVLALSDRPVIVSHTGLVSACPRTGNRNLPDATLQEIAARGGLVGITFFEGAVCDISADGIADTILVALDRLGEDAVALGSDFDGSVATTLDSADYALITDALLRRDVDERIIAKVMGGNAHRFFRDNLPG